MGTSAAAFTIRLATRDDVVAIVCLLADDPLGQQRERFQEPLPDSYYTAFEEITHDPNNELVVVEHDGEVIGTLQLTLLPSLTYQGGKRAQIEAVRIDRRYRGAGIGRQLFTWATARAREAGCHMLQLTTNVQRDDAQLFYAQLGFVASHTGLKLDLTREG